MFSNGDCSEWMVVENSQFNTYFGVDTSNTGVARRVIASHHDIDYTAEFTSRAAKPEDPWITWNSYFWNSGASVIYGEASLITGDHGIPDRVLGHYFNVWIS